MMKKLKLMLTILILITNLFGCWSQRELTDIAIVSALGVDFAEDGDFILTFQVVNPHNIGASSIGGSGQTGPPVNVYQAKADTVVEATRQATKHISRVLYFAHTGLLVIGEEVANKGIIELLESFIRSSEFRSTTKVIIAKDAKASELLTVTTPIDQVPTEKIVKTLELTEKTFGSNFVTDLKDISDFFQKKGGSPLISSFIIEGKKDKGNSVDNVANIQPDTNLTADGIAIFKEGKIKTWAHGKNARGISWILKKVKDTAVNVEWEGEPKAIDILVNQSKTKVNPELKQGEPSIKVQVVVEGHLVETTVALDLRDPQIISKVNQAMSKQIKKEIEDTIKFAQENNVDCFQFGDHFRRKYPKYWDRVQDEWVDDIFPILDVEVEVDAFVRRTELKFRPYFYPMKKPESVRE